MRHIAEARLDDPATVSTTRLRYAPATHAALATTRRLGDDGDADASLVMTATSVSAAASN